MFLSDGCCLNVATSLLRVFPERLAASAIALVFPERFSSCSQLARPVQSLRPSTKVTVVSPHAATEPLGVQTLDFRLTEVSLLGRTISRAVRFIRWNGETDQEASTEAEVFAAWLVGGLEESVLHCTMYVIVPLVTGQIDCTYFVYGVFIDAVFRAVWHKV